MPHSGGFPQIDKIDFFLLLHAEEKRGIYLHANTFIFGWVMVTEDIIFYRLYLLQAKDLSNIRVSLTTVDNILLIFFLLSYNFS